MTTIECIVIVLDFKKLENKKYKMIHYTTTKLRCFVEANTYVLTCLFLSFGCKRAEDMNGNK